MARSADNLAASFADLRISETLTVNTHGCIKLTALTDKLRKSSGVKLNELKVRKGLHNLFVAVWKS
jgi:hypothetical protein